MEHVNEVHLIGEVAFDIDVKSVGQRGTSLAKVMLKTNYTYKDEKKFRYVQVTCWGQWADILDNTAPVGSIVEIKANVERKSWTDRDDKKRYDNELTATHVQVLEGAASPPPQQQQDSAPPDIPDDEVPF